MPKMIGINIGFVTNSSSMVYHFPKELMNDPVLKTFIDAMEIEDGFIGNDLWSRSACASFAVSKEQKAALHRELQSSEYCTGPGIDVEGEFVVVVFGDEYPGLAMTLSSMFKEAAVRAGLPAPYGVDYN